MKQILLFFIVFSVGSSSITAAPVAIDLFYRAISMDSLPNEDDLLKSLERYYQSKLMAELSEFTVSEKNAWLKYLPTVGVGYNLGVNSEGQLTSKLRPTVSFSTNVMYQKFQDKAARTAKLASIQQSNRLEFEAEKRELLGMIKQYQYLREEFIFMESIGKIEVEIFNIETEKYKAAEIPPSQYLPKKKAFLKERYEQFKKKQQIADLYNQILIKAKS